MKKLVFWIVAVAVGGIFVIAILNVMELRETAKRVICQGNLSVIGTAMHRYHDKYGHFPPAFVPDEDGKPKHSWRVLILEFLDSEAFFEYKMDEPWDGPNNRKLHSKMPQSYACKSDVQAKENNQTNYFVVVGSGTVFPGSMTRKLDDIKSPMQSTILVVEAIGQKIHWMEPKDLDFDTISFKPNDPERPSISSRHINPTVCCVDGSKILVANISPEKLRRMCLVDDE